MFQLDLFNKNNIFEYKTVIERNKYIALKDSFICPAGTIFYPYKNNYYIVKAITGKKLKFDRLLIERNAEFFKIYSKPLYTREQVIWFIKRYLDNTKPHVTLEELFNTLEERIERELTGKKYKI